VFDEKHHLISVTRRSPAWKCETRFDAETGEKTHFSECASLPDGNMMTKDVAYDGENSIELVIVTAPNGETVRRVERETNGEMIVYQGNTEYSDDGIPTTTINHFMDQSTGQLIRREQIHWLNVRQRLLRETYSFDLCGRLYQYSKVFYLIDAGPYLEEVQHFDVELHMLIKRELTSFNRTGDKTRTDVLTYNEPGQITKWKSKYFDTQGREIEARSQIC
jgi:hypothetical protein